MASERQRERSAVRLGLSGTRDTVGQPRAGTPSRQVPAADALTAFGAAHPDVLLVDPRPRFESAPEGADLFRDIGHLTPAGERLLATAVDERVAPLLAHARLTSRRPFDEPLQPPQSSHRREIRSR